jgi:hypothetical protein
MDLAIAPSRATGCAGNGPPGPDAGAWEVLLLRRERGQEVASRVASFGHRAHAEAFLADLLGRPAGAVPVD